MMKALVRIALAIVASLAIGAPPARGFIMALYPLDKVLDEANVVVAGTFSGIDAEAKTGVARVERTLKGDCPFREFRLNIGPGQLYFPEVLLKRLKPGMPFVLFYQVQADSNGNYAALAYADGFFFQFFADKKDRPEDVMWNFTHIEIHMSRTFSGETAALESIVRDAAAGKRKPPAPEPDRPSLTEEGLRRLAKPKPEKAKKPPDPADRIFTREIRLPRADGDGWGAAIGDSDGDGRLDVLVCSTGGNRLYRQREARRFEEATKESGLSGGSKTAAFADLDGDGDLDLVTSAPSVWIQDGGVFRDETDRWLGKDRTSAESAACADVDGDGRPDLVMLGGESKFRVLKNRDGARFEDAGGDWRLPGEGGMFLAMDDVDGDGFLDVFRGSGPAMLARNLAGRGFSPETLAIPRLEPDAGRGALADVDGDGSLDLFLPDKRRLLRNSNDGTFRDALAQSGDLAKLPPNACAAAFGDVDRDGRIDLAVAFRESSLRLFSNAGNGTFEDRTEASGIGGFESSTGPRAMSFVDIDEDGDLDLLLAGRAKAFAAILVNNAPRKKNPRSALRVAIRRGVPPGTRVRLYDESAALLASQGVGLFGSADIQGPPEALFFVPPGRFRIGVVFPNGRSERTIVDPGPDGARWDVPATKP
ncbi:MAG: VCBS repeat-containing protein [Planctomycetota bacterium]